ncbi:hypothetical protein MRX96_058242 [Rhipicephalus microplus]
MSGIPSECTPIVFPKIIDHTGRCFASASPAGVFNLRGCRRGSRTRLVPARGGNGGNGVWSSVPLQRRSARERTRAGWHASSVTSRDGRTPSPPFWQSGRRNHHLPSPARWLDVRASAAMRCNVLVQRACCTVAKLRRYDTTGNLRRVPRRQLLRPSLSARSLSQSALAFSGAPFYAPLFYRLCLARYLARKYSSRRARMLQENELKATLGGAHLGIKAGTEKDMDETEEE